MIGWALGLPLIRVALVAAAAVITWLVLRGLGAPAPFPPTMLSSLSILPVNVACLALVRHRLHREGRRVRDLIGFEPRRLPTDLLWALLWLAVLYVPFVAVIMGVMAISYGAELFTSFETVFAAPSGYPELSPVAGIVLGVIIVVTFAPLNAPTEELIFRGYSQDVLARRMPSVVAIGVLSLIFGAQHLFFAPTPAAALVFACAFVAWGFGSGLIVRRQRRLMPIIGAHVIVNLVFTLPALIFGALTLSG